MQEPREQIEAAIIYAMMNDNDALEYGMMELNREHFLTYPDAFDVIAKHYVDSAKVDVAVLHSEGIEMGRITAIVSSTTTSAYIESHTKTLKDYDYAFRMKKFANDILASEGTSGITDIVDNMPMYESSSIAHVSTKEMTQKVLAEIGRRARANDDIKGIRTHFKRFDALTGGLAKGGVTVIDGATNIGKSLVVEKLGLNIAGKGKRVDYFAYEMSDDQCVERMLSMSAGVPIKAINNPKREWMQAQTMAVQDFAKSQELENINFFADELVLGTVSELKAKVNRETARSGRPPSLIIVDYVELMSGPGETDIEITRNNFEELMRFAKKLKETNIVIILSRNKSGQTSGSNKLAYHAHMHIKLEPDETAPGLIVFDIIKNRCGGKGMIDFIFDASHLMIMEAERDVRN